MHKGGRTRRPTYELLNKISRWQSNKLRIRLFQDGIKEKKCEICLLTTWNGKPIPLELDHINGNKYDNRLKNLRILCPNCHAQTHHYRGRNIGKYGSVSKLEKETHLKCVG